MTNDYYITVLIKSWDKSQSKLLLEAHNLDQQFFNSLVSGPLYTLKNYRGTSKSFCLYGLVIFNLLEIKPKNNKKIYNKIHFITNIYYEKYIFPTKFNEVTSF